MRCFSEEQMEELRRRLKPHADCHEVNDFAKALEAIIADDLDFGVWQKRRQGLTGERIDAVKNAIEALNAPGFPSDLRKATPWLLTEEISMLLRKAEIGLSSTKKKRSDVQKLVFGTCYFYWTETLGLKASNSSAGGPFIYFVQASAAPFMSLGERTVGAISGYLKGEFRDLPAGTEDDHPSILPSHLFK